ncbi:helix-turn-helix transcriptional regulator [Streptomyces sp. NBC_00059]|uniref:helix-turn-helix domain-containing protein n=1 Tax=Streptomyces sp. NBC_00059 TaxID=2975635 RepID=UPI00224E426A|nr:helix-turn-helix transcriptional regulator [Streptomyces sp. NBC_00059]MCX5410419.1 helix-turn-helix domain-containing protein [Streptomyces sp. NBC_00059]
MGRRVGMSAETASRLLGVDRSRLSNIEQGLRAISQERVRTLAQGCHCPNQSYVDARTTCSEPAQGVATGRAHEGGEPGRPARRRVRGTARKPEPGQAHGQEPRPVAQPRKKWPSAARRRDRTHRRTRPVGCGVSHVRAEQWWSQGSCRSSGQERRSPRTALGGSFGVVGSWGVSVSGS